MKTVITITLTGNKAERSSFAASIRMIVSTLWLAFKPKDVDLLVRTRTVK